jgi:hypothetical protein
MAVLRPLPRPVVQPPPLPVAKWWLVRTIQKREDPPWVVSLGNKNPRFWLPLPAVPQRRIGWIAALHDGLVYGWEFSHRKRVKGIELVGSLADVEIDARVRLYAKPGRPRIGAATIDSFQGFHYFAQWSDFAR